MDQNLIISENYPELVQMFIGEDIYLPKEKVWYDAIASEGGNKYRFLNIVMHGDNEIIPEAKREFFFKLINAIRTDRITMDGDGFAVVNAMNYKGLNWKNLEHHFSPKYCIFWGVDPIDFEIPCKLFGGALKDDCRILYVPSMEELSTNTEMKKKLWLLVQRMFGMEKSK